MQSLKIQSFYQLVTELFEKTRPKSDMVNCAFLKTDVEIIKFA